MRRVMALGALALVAGPERAGAEQCSNPCGVGDGDLCVQVKPVVELGRTLSLRAGRQSGTCGGVRALPADQLALTWSRDPAGPFTPVPGTPHGQDLAVKPDGAGAYFVEAAARDGKGAPDRLVVMVVDPATQPVQLRLRPGKGLAAASTAVKLRWVPAKGEDRFPRRRWPVWADNDRAGFAERPLRLPPGHYDVEWRHQVPGHTQAGVTPIDVTGPGTVDVVLSDPPAPPVPPAPPPARPATPR